jgi:prepilin-type N-terminal cleavage/methylation domain-containing protein
MASPLPANCKNVFAPLRPKSNPRTIMKNQSRRRSHGFTLIELLVVISIIVVLAAAGFAAGNAAILRARKATALATATAIESAVNNFYTEYGSMPTSSSSTQDDTVETDNVQFLNILLGQEGTGTNVLNTRAIRFLSVKEGKGKKNGLIYNSGGATVLGLYDPWGGTFKVKLDLDYDEKVSNVKPESKNAKTVTLNGRRVAVWSEGADFEDKDTAADDVLSWGN